MKTDIHWKTIGLTSHHGIALPLSALHTKNSHGIGEFLDLIPLIDFCKEIGFDTIQLLPINESGYDQSPYTILSSTALNPIYISISELGIFDPELKKLTLTKRVEYAKVRQRKLALLKDYYDKNKTHENFEAFLQALCFSQMEYVRAYAEKNHCFLKGDIPILLSSNSEDIKKYPSLFNDELVAGAPPDMYNKNGQKWGFPIMNWEKMREKHFAWWIHRLTIASHLYHIYRIDHVVGLFRIWAIPKDKEAKDGFFIPEDTNLWEKQGREILEMMLHASQILPIAEDLGIVPPEVRKILKEYGICGTKVMRWERKYSHHPIEYIPFEEYEPYSLTTVSTHDSETLQQWWKNNPAEAKPFAELKQWTYQPDLTIEQRFDLLHDAHHTPSYFHINLLQEYLAIFPELVSENPDDERINIPGEVLPTNWSYRFRPSIEQMQKHPQLISSMQKIKGQ
ncbi:MAG TPA: 4-alpha-glucanotransferase [Chlamydiales bacterium]|nr:4-alpha-glucanotransferase [Chlamydiales bacterium]